MAVITTPNFDPLLSYVRVRLAQGVPIVDADVNEREDIDLFELRAFLKWFVGDGVPEGNDAFRILESTASRNNNFRISSGFGTATDALSNAGRCLVNGLDVMITGDEEFTGQDLFETQANIASVEARLRSPRILGTAMNAMTAGTLHVWLDVWDALVTPNDSPADNAHMIHAGLGTESCSRDRRYWAVRVRTSNTPPATGDPEFAVGHSYYRIAEITRRAGDANVNQADITDLREKRLLVPPSTIIPDLFNVSVLDYRRGNGRPTISFRQAINALIRGEVPATPELALTTTVPVSRNFSSRGTFFIGGAIGSVWTSTRNGSFQIFFATLEVANPAAGFSPASVQALTSGLPHQSPHAVPLLNGDVLVAYEEVVAPSNEDAKLRYGSLTTGFLAQQDIAIGVGRQRKPFCVPVGNTAGSEQVIVMWHDSNVSNRWRYNLYQVSSKSFPTPTPNDLSAASSTTPDLHAAKDAAGNVWIAFVTSDDIQVVEFPFLGTPSNSPMTVGGPTNVPTFVSATTVDKNPFVLVDGSNVPWVFWVSTAAGASSIVYSRRDPATSNWSAPVAIPGAPAGNYVSNGPVAVIADDGAIWVFWDSFLNTVPAGNKDIWYARLDPVSGVWTGHRPTTGTALPDQDAVTLSRGDGVIWLFWTRLVSGTQSEVFSRRLITTV